jgi:hypothetical protein
VATEFTYTDTAALEPRQSAPFDMIISDGTSAEMVSGSLNVESSEYAMIPPVVVFEMDGQGGGDSQGEVGSLGGGSIGGSPDEGDNGDGDDGDNGDNGGDGTGHGDGDGGDGGDGGDAGTIDIPSLFG